MVKKTVSRRNSINEYIYPDFKKCQIILFTLVLLEYLNILVLTFYNSKKEFLNNKLLGFIFFFEFLGLIFVVLALRSLNKKKWRKGKRVVLFFIYLLIHIAYKRKNNMGSKFTIITYIVISGILTVGQIIYFIIFSIYTKNTWRPGDGSLV
ncbi:hypothetical protein PIROE2DRAFT_4593 [Piromyces sp. E2]|nr:hypothetical protein PIROE2DRAFT_4593 [Piromyces sp. E2]|eukprot:OUM67911.1 hypothetical protein PIROE2DRAFT_4593 [Piromyces sp. E2]